MITCIVTKRQVIPIELIYNKIYYNLNKLILPIPEGVSALEVVGLVAGKPFGRPVKIYLQVTDGDTWIGTLRRGKLTWTRKNYLS